MQFGLDKERIVAFPRLTYDEAMRRYGSDKPDTRFGLELFDVSELVKDSGFGVFKNTVAAEGRVRGVRYPGGHRLSRKEVAELEDLAKQFGAKGMASVYVELPDEEVEGSVVSPAGRRYRSSIVKFFDLAELDSIYDAAGAEPGDLLCFVADDYAVTCEALNRLRLQIGDKCGLRDRRKLNFLYVVDFPLVEWNPDQRRWDPSHHPFTSPKMDDLRHMATDPGKMRADCYDLVCNGTEMASGSIRIHQPELQAKMFELIGLDEEQQQARFAHILEAFSYGAPPHGGMAPGIDRLVMALLDEENISEVIAFPKMGNGYDPLMDSPSLVDEAQWQELGLQVRPSLTAKQPV